MPTRNVNLTKHFDKFVEDGVVSGRCGNASEVVTEGLLLLEKQEAGWKDHVMKEAQEGIDAIERGDYILIESDYHLHRVLSEAFDQAVKENAAERRTNAPQERLVPTNGP